MIQYYEDLVEQKVNIFKRGIGYSAIYDFGPTEHEEVITNYNIFFASSWQEINYFVCEPTVRKCIGGWNSLYRFDLGADAIAPITQVDAAFNNTDSYFRNFRVSQDKEWFIYASGLYQSDIPGASKSVL